MDQLLTARVLQQQQHCVHQHNSPEQLDVRHGDSIVAYLNTLPANNYVMISFWRCSSHYDK